MQHAKKAGLAVVTGASTGIGREIALRLAKRGHDVMLVSRTQQALDELAGEVREAHGVAAEVVAVDLSSLDGVSQVLAALDGRPVEVLVNNAGVGLYGEHAKLEAAALERMLLLNIVSLTTLCQAIGAGMRDRGRGSILNIASTAAYQPVPYMAAYGASKSYVLNFSEALAKELEDFGVTVSCVSPGPTDTPFFADMDRAGIANKHFAKEGRTSAGEVADVALAALDAKVLSKLVGTGNALLAWSTRLVPRAMVASMSKDLLRAPAIRG